MWDKWRERIKGMFSGDSPEEVDVVTPRNTSSKQNSHVGAKVIYQYPKNNSFKFPVIPDNQSDESRVEIPATQHEKKSSAENDITEEDQVEEEKHPNRKVEVKSYQRFTPSRVPSPIYGFNKRSPENKVEEIPAYIRKERKETQLEKGLDPVPKYEEIQHVHFEEELPEQEVPIAIFEESTDIPNKPVEELKVVNEETVSQDRELNNKPTKRAEERKMHIQKPREQSEASPFNVIMTPRDRKILMDKQKAKAQKQSLTVAKHDVIVPATEPDDNYMIPYHLLNDPVESSSEDRLWVQSQQELLERTLMHFNVEAKVVKATQGPSVTRFEVHPEFGVRVSKIKNLSDDIKLNMSARDIRIEAPIPGKNTIGIEVPNLKSQMVGLQEIFQTDAFQSSKSPLTIGLGLTVEGHPLITNISKMPHGLIAGATGSGKSVCINTILISLIYKSSYKDVKFLLIDPKMVELAPYNGIPHLVAPVITDIKAATAALKWAVAEMEERYEKFVKESVRDIERYNEKLIKQGRIEEKMPFLVIVIDELADLMMMSPQDVEEAICRIAQKARACGIHLLLATQRPSVDVITGLIKANIPTRIAFSVSSQVDSRTIIDTGGADRLLGKGDMLFIENGSGKSLRLQGPYVSDEEIERITNFVRTLAPPNYLFEQEELLTQIESNEEEDELFTEVLDFILEQGSVSTSLLQRQFRIGYNRAARLIDSLEKNGVISGQNGSKPRDLLLSKSQVDEVF